MDARKSSELQLQPEQKLWVNIVKQAYHDLYFRSERAEDRYNDVDAREWLNSVVYREYREMIFDLAGINQESMNRDTRKSSDYLSSIKEEDELLGLISGLITRNTV